jgi:2-polyprenyl-3-methyl-5-hydroxy-6-metoxy-1,4-benzoquinol methylase
MINFVDPDNFQPLIQIGDYLQNEKTGKKIATIKGEIPRFVSNNDIYVENFGWQWNTWEHTNGSAIGPRVGLKEEILHRTQFFKYNFENKAILECGMGGGDDTEVLASLPFAEIHSFDLSNSVEKAAKHIKDKRLRISQASIYEIPYPDNTFDVVYCHRVLQHTPNPVRALKAICAKVSPGGLLFAHSYKRSWRNMMQWKYKYRWITKHLPLSWVYWYVQKIGPLMHSANRVLYNFTWTKYFAYALVPFYYLQSDSATNKQKLEFGKLATFDALTPKYDDPMTAEQFFGTIRKEGFEILNKHDPKSSPMWCTARKK